MQVDKEGRIRLYIILIPIAIYLGILFGELLRLGIHKDNLLESIMIICENPWSISYLKSDYLFEGLGYAAGMYVIFVLYIESVQKKFMFGKEHGTAQWGDAKRITKQLQDADPGFNRYLSKNVRISYNTRKTKLNNNTVFVGGSGSGKTLFVVLVNILLGKTSMIVTDPKGGIVRDIGNFLKKMGVHFKVLNLKDPSASNGFNPFKYIRSESDVLRLIKNLMSNTTDKNAQKGDQFWEDSQALYFQSIFFYVWLEEPMEKRNFRSVMDLMAKANIPEDGSKSEFSIVLEELGMRKGNNHPAVRAYNKFMAGAGDTLRSIIISANSRLAYLDNKEILDLLEYDELNLDELGVGKNGDKKTRSILFCVIPDNDTSFNFVVGMLYTLAFQELYYQADVICGGRLPVPVSLWMDEFANIALPDDTTSIIATIRSREIYMNIILQNVTQLKTLFKDSWETILGNCDVFVYLGGNEQSSHKYVSESFDQQTIDKRSDSESKGRSGSYSKSHDVLGRALMTPGEVRKVKRDKCLILIAGEDPIIDKKFPTLQMKEFKEAQALGPYTHKIDKKVLKQKMIKPTIEFIDKDSLEYYKSAREKENVEIYSFTYEELILMDEDSLLKALPEHLYKEPEEEIVKAAQKQVQKEDRYAVFEYITANNLTFEQQNQVAIAIKNGLQDKDIMRFLDKDNTPEKMEEMRKLIEMDYAM